MFEEIKNIKTGVKDIRSFGFTIGVILIIVSSILFYYNNLLFKDFLIIAAFFIILGAIVPLLLKPIYLIWMTFAAIIGWVMTRVILSVVFYFIITPIGILTRILGKDFLALKKVKSDSYWNSRDSDYETNQDYEKQY